MRPELGAVLAGFVRQTLDEGLGRQASIPREQDGPHNPVRGLGQIMADTGPVEQGRDAAHAPVPQGLGRALPEAGLCGEHVQGTVHAEVVLQGQCPVQFPVQLHAASGQPVQHGRGLEPLDGFGGRAQSPPPFGQVGIAGGRQIDRGLGILPFFEQLLDAVAGGHGCPGTGDQQTGVGVGGAAGHLAPVNYQGTVSRLGQIPGRAYADDSRTDDQDVALACHGQGRHSVPNKSLR